MQKWYQNYTTLDAVGGAYENAANNFFSGNVAMICNGPWMIGDFSDTSKTPDGFDQNVGVAAYPGNFVYDAPIEGMFVTKQDDPALEEAAIAMVKFFTSPESQQLALEMQGMVPAAASVEITDTATTNFPLLGEFLNIASRMHGTFQHLHRQHGSRPTRSLQCRVAQPGQWHLHTGAVLPDPHRFCCGKRRVLIFPPEMA